MLILPLSLLRWSAEGVQSKWPQNYNNKPTNRSNWLCSLQDHRSLIASSSKCSERKWKLVPPGFMMGGFVLCNIEERPHTFHFISFCWKPLSRIYTVISEIDVIKSKEFISAKFLVKQAFQSWLLMSLPFPFYFLSNTRLIEAVLSDCNITLHCCCNWLLLSNCYFSQFNSNLIYEM